MFGAEAFPRTTTGTDLVVASNRIMTATGSGGPMADVQPMSPMETMKEVFFDIRDSLQAIVANTLETNELLKVGVLGTPAEQRDELIEGGETDSQGNPPADEGGPSFLDRLSNLNPFKGGIGTFGKFLVAIGALVGLKLFGDKLIPGLASLLETIKEGKITETIKGIYLDIKEKVLVKFEELKLAIADVIEGVKTVITKVKEVYTSITDYINTFNVDGEGALNEDEKKALQKDIMDKIGNFIYDTVGETLLAITSVFAGVKVAQILLGINALKLGPAALAAAPGAAGLLGTAALVALAAAGIYRGYQNVQFALNDSIDEETGKLDTSEFASKLVAGRNPEGGILNATINAFDKGLIGLSAGAIIGFLIGGPPGAIIGARIGSLAGSAIGAISGYIGSDTFDKTLTTMGDNFTTNMDNVSSFITGVPTAYDADEEALTKDLNLMNDGLNTLKTQKAELESQNKGTGFIDKTIKDLEVAIEKQKTKIANVDVAFADRMSSGEIGDIDDQIKATQNFINEMKKNILTGGEVIDTPTGQITLDPPSQADIDAQLLIIDELKKKRRDLILLYKKFEDGKLGDGNEIQFESESMKKKTSALGLNKEAIESSNRSSVMANNNNQLSQIFKEETHSHGGLSSGDNFMTAVMAANKNAKMQTG